VIVDFYEQVGYLPDALLNYLLLLGWSLDDKTEEFTPEEMLHHFSLERVNKAPASFDVEKLMSFESRAMQRLPIKQRVAKAVPFLQRAKLVAEPPSCDTGPYVTRLLEAAGDRVKVAGDVLDFDDFFVADGDLQIDESAFDKRVRKPAIARDLLSLYREKLALAEPFNPESLEKLTHEFVETNGIKVGDIVHAVRVAVTGKAVGFGLFETLALLGRERCVGRIDRAIQRAGDSPPSAS
jgi:glutamyl-tRNA synthetase